MHPFQKPPTPATNDTAPRITPNKRWATKGAGVDAPVRELGWEILLAFPRFGGPPPSTWIAQRAAERHLDAAAALAELERCDLLRCDPARGAIVVAYPFSGVPTAHRVAIAGAQQVYAMCAIDALGIPFMLGRDAVITSTDPWSGDAVRVMVRGGQARWDPPDAVVLVPDCDGPTPSAAVSCPEINFFRSAVTARAYQRAHPGRSSVILDPDTALAAGRCIFGLPDGQAEPCGACCCPDK